MPAVFEFETVVVVTAGRVATGAAREAFLAAAAAAGASHEPSRGTDGRAAAPEELA